jgi:hypothetical protein
MPTICFALGHDDADNTVLVSVMHANNETGVIQPIAEIVRAVRDHEAAAGGRQANAQFITMRLVTMAPCCGFREPI